MPRAAAYRILRGVGGKNKMRRYQTFEFDNRDAGQMYDYLEARIDALKRRISELETENAKLRCEAEDSMNLLSVCA